MNNSNPLVPQGSMLEQKSKGHARTRLAVFFVCILAVHVIGLMALLMAGCKREQPASPPPETNVVPPTFEPTNLATVETNALIAPPVAPPPAAAPTATLPPTPTPSTTEYVVAKGDSFYSIGKKLGLSSRAIQEANPGVDSTKLKVGQKLAIPSPASSPPALAGQPATGLLPGSEQVYVVKSGDTLTKIAAKHGATVKALRAANALKTDKIKVGQRLKIPVKTAAPTPSAPAEAVPMSPAPVPAPAIPPGQ